MIADVKKNQVAVVPSKTTSSVVLGASSALEAGSEVTVQLEMGPVGQPEHEEVRSYLAPEDASFQAIAAISRQRAERLRESAAAWTHAGFAALVDKKIENAREAFQRALEIAPSYRNAVLGLARTAHEAGEPARAEELLRGLIHRSPRDIEAQVSLAVVLVSQGRPEEGLNVLDRDVAPSPEHASYLAVRGSIRLLLGRVHAAISDLRKAVRFKPEWVHPRNVLGLAELRAGRLGPAERQFLAAVRTAPMHEASLLNLLAVLRMQNRWEDVMAHIERYWRPGVASTRLAQRAAEASLETGNPRMARAWLEPIRGRGDSPDERGAILNNLGVAYSRLKLLSEAEVAFAESVTAQPTDVNVANRARILLERGAKEDAVAWLTPWLDHSAVVGAGIETTLAIALVSLGHYGQALEVVRHTVDRPNVSESTFGVLSSLYADFLRDYDGAAGVALKGLETWPSNPPLINNLAYALLMGDRIPDAVAWLSSVDRDRLPPDKRVYFLATTGLLELKRGNLHEGRQLYEAALALAGEAALRERIKAKRDLELARAQLRLGLPRREALRLLERASESPQAAEPYASHAREELRLLKTAADPEAEMGS